MNKTEKILEKGIYAMIPMYQPSAGNVTRIITEDGSSYIDSRTLRTMIKVLCKYYAIHLEHAREKYGQMIHQRIAIPLPFDQRLLLLPVKVRKPMFSKDGACGYINLYGIADLKEKEGNTLVCLKNGVEIECLHRLKTVQQHVKNAKIVSRDFNLYGKRAEELDTIQEFLESYQAPATKADIAYLHKEMLAVVKELKTMIYGKSRA